MLGTTTRGGSTRQRVGGRRCGSPTWSGGRGRRMSGWYATPCAACRWPAGSFGCRFGTGADGRPLYAIPGLAMQYRVPNFAAAAPVDLSPEGTVTAGPLPPEGTAVTAQGPVTTAQVPAGAAEGPVVTGPPSPVLLLASPETSPSSSPAAPPAAGALVDDGGGGGISPSEQNPQAEPLVAALDFRGRPPGMKQRRQLVALTAAALDGGWSEQDLKAYLDLGGAAVNSAAAVYAHRLSSDELPDPAAFREAARRPLEGTDAAVDGWMALSRQLGGHQPYQDSWRRLEAEAANGARPAGWERVPHCGDPNCDEVTRRRDTVGADGLRTAAMCGSCHPSMRF